MDLKRCKVRAAVLSYKQSFSFALLVWSLPVCGSAQESIPPNEFQKSICDKTVFYGKIYHYRVEISEGDSTTTSLRELRVGVPEKGSEIVPYLMIESIENPGDPLSDDSYLVSRWEGFNIRETRRFEREFFDLEHSNMHENRACILGQVGPYTGLSETDPFLKAVFASPCGIFILSQQQYDPVYDAGESVLVGSDETWGRVFEVQRKSGPELTELVYSDRPESLEIKTETKSVSARIDSFQMFEGVRVPQRGFCNLDYRTTHRSAKFELISVKKCDIPVESWFPKLPTGTALIDYPNDMVTVEPRTAEEEDLIRKYAFSKKQSTFGSKTTRVLIVLVNASVILGVFAWWRRKHHA